MKVSLICTVLNEADNIDGFLVSLKQQTRLPDEVVICDAGSIDDTVKILQDFGQDFSRPVNIIIEPGNRSHGRNVAIVNATYDLIAGTDAGCILDSFWLERLITPFEKESSIDVVSGFYSAQGETAFEKCAAVVTLSTSNINPETFLPSCRSIAFRRAAWKSAGGFPEHLDFAEDTFFALALRNSGKRFAFAGDALVYWRPRTSIGQVYRQARNYARGNREAGILYMNYVRLHIRYGVWLGLTFAMLTSAWFFILWFIACVPYWTIWSVAGWKASHELKSIIVTPWIKLVSDAGAFAGFWSTARLRKKT